MVAGLYAQRHGLSRPSSCTPAQFHPCKNSLTTHNVQHYLGIMSLTLAAYFLADKRSWAEAFMMDIDDATHSNLTTCLAWTWRAQKPAADGRCHEETLPMRILL